MTNKIFLTQWILKPAPKSLKNIPDDISFPEKGIKAKSPEDVYLALMDSNLIPDPFYADNELRLKWLAQCNWEYETTFDCTAANELTSLVFDGLDTFADIYLNNALLGHSENMFVRYVFDIRKNLLDGENHLRIFFYSPLQKAMELKTDIKQLPSARHPNRAFTRKAQYSFGWDWGPEFPAMGIWKDVYLQKDHVEIKNIGCETLSIINNSAKVRVTFSFSNPEKKQLSFEVQLKHEEHSFLSSLKSDTSLTVSIVLDVEKAKLWWPHNIGKPHLYSLQINAVDSTGRIIAQEQKKVGIRVVELKLKEADKNCFKFFINNQLLFLKGANWIPADSFLPRIDKSTYSSLIESARDANMNVLRVWGGGIYEEDYFYELCDQLGILVWQDFMFACATYPDNDEFLENVKTEVTQNVNRLKYHPSILIWCGNNEIEWIWYRDNLGPVKKMQGFDFFHKIIPGWLKEFDGSRPYWPSSPFGDEEDPNSELSGNRHAWDIWSQWIDYSEVVNDKSLFVTEFGFQAPATLQTLKTAIPHESLNPQSELFEFHNKQDEGTERLFRFMSAHLPVKTDIESFIYLTQLNQGLALKTCLEHWRLRWPETSGSIIWQINDCWPVSSWALIDSDLRYKHSYFFTKHSFENILLGFISENEKVKLVVLNDNPVDLFAELKIYLWDFHLQSLYEVKKQVLTILASQKYEGPVYEKNELQNKCIIADVLDGQGKMICRNFYNVKQWKHVSLPKADYSIDLVAVDTLSIKAGSILFFLKIEHPHIEFKNFPEVVLPGEVYKIQAKSAVLTKKIISELQVKTLNNYLC